MRWQMKSQTRERETMKGKADVLMLPEVPSLRKNISIELLRLAEGLNC